MIRNVAPTRLFQIVADDEANDPAVAAAYSPNYARLRSLKSKFDPDNVIKTNVNVLPG